MWNIFKFFKKHKKIVYTLKDLPKGYEIEKNGIGEYRWKRNYTLTNYSWESICTFLTLSEAVESAISHHKERETILKQENWKTVKSDGEEEKG